jgi:hypothetical protein
VKGGIAYGKTDEISGAVEEDKVHVHDFHATLLHLLGFDPTKLTYRHAGRDFRLADVHGNGVGEILAEKSPSPGLRTVSKSACYMPPTRSLTKEDRESAAQITLRYFYKTGEIIPVRQKAQTP